MAEKIYVLELTNNKWYVGKTANVDRRVEQHKSGKGSAWTRKYKFVGTAECRTSTGKYDEDNTTESYMEKYGVEHVRGGSYSQVILSDDIIDFLHQKIDNMNGKCYSCRRPGHVGSDCLDLLALIEAEEAPAPKKEYIKKEVPKKEAEEFGCSSCDRTFATKYGLSLHEKACKKADPVEEEFGCSSCDRTFATKYGLSLHAKACKSVEPVEESAKKAGKCFKCGFYGHYSPDCRRPL